MINYYTILGITQTASAIEIKKAYHKLAMQYHPDKNPGNTTAEAKMKQINAAYATLSDPQLKYGHDQFLMYRNRQPSFSTTHQPSTFTKRSAFQNKQTDEMVEKIKNVAAGCLAIMKIGATIAIGLLVFAIYKGCTN